MNNDRLGRTPAEIVDEARHCYAVGTVRLRAIADELSEIAQKGEGISQSELLRLLDHLVMVYALIGYHADCEMKNDLRAIAEELREIAQKGEAINQLELKRLHDQLVRVYALIGYHTVFEMDIEDGVPMAVYQDTYSDGTPVSIVVGPPSSRGWSWFLPDDVYDCKIPWLPNTTGNDPYVGEGPTPPGCEVFVVNPPHRRKSNTRAVWQEANWDSEALKALLRETKG